MNITASYVKQDCFDVHNVSKDTAKPTKLLMTPDELLIVSLKLSSIKRNIYYKLEFYNNVNIRAGFPTI